MSIKIPSWVKPGAAAVLDGHVVIIDKVLDYYPEPSEVWFHRADGLEWPGNNCLDVWTYAGDAFSPVDPGIAALYGVDLGHESRDERSGE